MCLIKVISNNRFTADAGIKLYTVAQCKRFFLMTDLVAEPQKVWPNWFLFCSLIFKSCGAINSHTDMRFRRLPDASCKVLKIEVNSSQTLSFREFYIKVKLDKKMLRGGGILELACTKRKWRSITEGLTVPFVGHV